MDFLDEVLIVYSRYFKTLTVYMAFKAQIIESDGGTRDPINNDPAAILPVGSIETRDNSKPTWFNDRVENAMNKARTDFLKTVWLIQDMDWK